MAKAVFGTATAVQRKSPDRNFIKKKNFLGIERNPVTIYKILILIFFEYVDILQ